MRIFASILLIAYLSLSKAVYAEEHWKCENISTSGSAKDLPGMYIFKVEKNTLHWYLSPPLKLDEKNENTFVEYMIIENNDVGLVAVSSLARLSPVLGAGRANDNPLIGARVITLNRSSGELRMGSVMLTGEYDFLHGYCKLQ